MVSGARADGASQVLSDGVRRTIQSIKEIVGNHSDADIYVALKETNMDPNETTQKLLNQDPFHEVKRKRDRKKENSENKGYVAAEPRKTAAELAHIPVKYGAYTDHNAQRGGFGRTAASGGSREFRVVRDNRVNQSAVANNSTSIEGVVSNSLPKSSLTESSGHPKPLVGQNSSQALNGPGDSQPRQTKDSVSSNDKKEMVGERRVPAPSGGSRVPTKANVQSHVTNSSSSSATGVYSSSSDPIHVPSLHSRRAANVGAIRREVGVVGPRRQSSENTAKSLPPQSTPSPNNHSGADGHSLEPGRPFNSISKNVPSGQRVDLESVVPGLHVNRSVSSNQHGNRAHQFKSYQKAPQPHKKWKPKSSLKPNTNGPNVHDSSAKIVTPPDESSEDMKKESAQLQDKMSQLSLSENENVIIAPHIRVSEADRCRLAFGSLGTNLDSSVNSFCPTSEGAEKLSSTEPCQSVSVSVPQSSVDELAGVGNNQLQLIEDRVESSGSDSPSPTVIHEHKLIQKNESLDSQKSDKYVDVGIVQANSPPYSTESLQHQDDSKLPCFSGYEPQMPYDISYLAPRADETFMEAGLPSSQEVLNTHATNTISTSTIPMVQQQQQPQLTQMYPQVHVSHFANLMPYRQYLSPVYVPPMPVAGYSSNPAYPHPTNGSSYLLLPGNSSHIAPNGVKYGIQQFKHAPPGSQSGFGNFPAPTDYTVNTPGIVGSPAGLDDSSRLKYKDNLFAPNPQAETSEIWMNPRDVPGLQSASYYNMPGPTSHPAYLASHGSHASFNATTQSSHMQFPGMYHTTLQPPAIASPHHMGPAIGSNVGVGVAAATATPGAQVGAYQQPQLGHFNWTGNF